VTRRGWVVLSKDLSIASNALERETLFEAGARVFLLSRQNLTGPDQTTAFVRALRRIRRIAVSEPAPFIARVSPSGEVRVLSELKRAWKRGRRPPRERK
jgi:PIN like domain